MPDSEVISIELRSEVLAAVDELNAQLGLRSRSATIERILTELLLASEEE